MEDAANVVFRRKCRALNVFITKGRFKKKSSKLSPSKKKKQNKSKASKEKVINDITEMNETGN